MGANFDRGGVLDDRTALDRIARLLADTPEWDSDMPDQIAGIIGQTDRVHPGSGVYPYLLPGDPAWPALGEGWTYLPPADPDGASIAIAFHGDRGQLEYSVLFQDSGSTDAEDAHEILVTEIGHNRSTWEASHWAWYDADLDRLRYDTLDGAATEPPSDFWRPRGSLVVQLISTARAIWRERTLSL